MTSRLKKVIAWGLVRMGLVYLPDSRQVELHNVASVLVDYFPAGYVSGDSTEQMPARLREWLETLEGKYGDVVVTPILPRSAGPWKGIAFDIVTGVRCPCECVSVKTWEVS